MWLAILWFVSLANAADMGVSCAMDDKYATPAEMEWRAWWSAVLAGAAARPRDLQASTGGGPGGAEWNTACDLVVWARLSAAESPEGWSVAGRPMAIWPGQPTLLVASVPLDTWQSQRRPAKRGEVDAEIRRAVSVVSLAVEAPTTQAPLRFLWAAGE